MGLACSAFLAAWEAWSAFARGKVGQGQVAAPYVKGIASLHPFRHDLLSFPQAQGGG